MAQAAKTAAGAIPPLGRAASVEGGVAIDSLASLCSRLLGVALVALSVFVALETVLRKAFSFSFQGADELGGYVLGIGSCLAFVVALVDRAHVRIDVLHQRLPVTFKVTLDWLSIVSLAALALFMAYVGWIVITDTLAYGSTAPTPWATPLIWPQSLWFAALCLFAVVAVLLAAKATWLLLRRRLEAIEEMFRPKGTMEELEEELSSLAGR